MEFAAYQLLSRLFGMVMGNGKVPIRRHGIRDVEVWDVRIDELSRLEREGGDIGLDFQVAQFCLTMAGSFLAGLILSPPPPESRRTFDVFAMLVIVGFIIGIIFGIKWYRSRGAFSETLREIRARQLGPIGDENHELKPAELAVLQPIEAPKQERAE